MSIRRAGFGTVAAAVLGAALLAATPGVGDAAGASRTAVQKPLVVDFTKVGGRCDGVHDDRDALNDAVQKVAAAGGGTVRIPAGTCRIVATNLHPWISLPANVTILGDSPSSTLKLQTADPASYHQLFSVDGDNVTLKSLTIVPQRDMYALLISLNGVDHFTMSGVTIAGQKFRVTGRELDAIRLQPDAEHRLTNTLLHDVTIEHVDYGLFQDNSIVGTTSRFRVEDSTFAGNWADDLEFNAPLAHMTGISIARSRFLNHRTPIADVNAGFAIGFAHVVHAAIVRNTFQGYRNHPVHVEDRSAHILIDRNHFSRSGTADTTYASHISVVGADRFIYLTHNSFDVSANIGQHVDCILLGDGGLVPSIGPDQVLVANNRFTIDPESAPLGRYPATHVFYRDNIVDRIS